MARLLTSVVDFLRGIIWRFYVWAPTVLLDAADYQERYIKPHFGWSIDLPDWVFPVALVGGLFAAAFLTYYDLYRQAGKPDVVFEVHDFDFLLNSRSKNRPEQPFDLATVNLRGRLRNRGDIRTDIQGARVALMERGWLWRWATVDEQKPQTMRNSIGAVIDPYYHGVSIPEHHVSRDISELCAYLSIPASIRPDTKRPYRIRVLMDAYGQTRPAPEYLLVDMREKFRVASATWRSYDELTGMGQ